MDFRKIATLCIAVSLCTPFAFADVEDDIFKSGVENTLKVLQYQKKLSLTAGQNDYANKLCYKINPKDGEVALDDFSVIKLEALSLIAETEPLYFSDNKNKNTLCFFTASGEEEYKAKMKLIEDKFKDIKAFKPEKITLSAKEGIFPTLPLLGKWNPDMSDTLGALNKEIGGLKVKIEEKDAAIADANANIREIIDTVKDIATKVESKAQAAARTVTPAAAIKPTMPDGAKATLQKQTAPKANKPMLVD